MLIIKPFNPVFFAMFALCILLAYLTSRLKKETAKKVIITVNIVCFVWLLIYKNTLFLDKDYVQICIDAHVELPTFWNGLPCHFCNILLVLTPFALMKGDRKLMAVATYNCFYSTALALLMPASGFSGYSLLLPRVFSFYCIHFAGQYTGFAILFSGFYEPNNKELFSSFYYTVGIYTLSYVVSAVLLKLKLSETVNFFYSISPRNNPVLLFFYRLLPMQYFYFIPIIALFMIPTGLVGFLWQKIKQLRNQRKAVQ